MSHTTSRAEYPCVRCGYALRGLAVGASCPECATPVLESMRDSPEQRRTSGWATASMVLGIVSVVGCMSYGLLSIVTGPPALVCWWLAKRQINALNVGGSSKGFALAGLITGLVGTAIGVVMLFFVVTMILSISNSSGYGASPSQYPQAPPPIIHGGPGGNPVPATPPGAPGARSVPGGGTP